MSTKKKNLDSYLSEVFKQFIAIKDEDYKKSQEVFKSVFDQVKQKMGEKCNYFSKYASQIVYAGSVSDGIKVTRLDEFDMDVVIRLPINYEDITIVSEQPGFVSLKIVDPFDHMDKQPDWEKCHKVTREWRDSEKYFLQNKFRHWMHSIVQKALNDMDGRVTVNKDIYLLTYKKSGPAYTLNIRNNKNDEEFKLDVDLVPVIRFLHPRWPEGYRVLEETTAKEWFVVPKPKKDALDDNQKNRCWRLSFQEFEKDMMKGCQQLKTTIRLVKKLRDSLDMKDIASYYIKTIFIQKIHDTNDKTYWQNKLSVLFRTMVEELYNAIKDKNIPYFWQDGNNLIGGLKPTIQKIYVDKLKKVVDSIDGNDVDKVVSYLLTTDELQRFKKSEFYEKQPKSAIPSQTAPLLSQVSRQNSVAAPMNAKMDTPQTTTMMDLLMTINKKMDVLNSKLESQNKRMEKLELLMANKMDMLTDKIEEQNDKLKLASMKKDILNTVNRGSFGVEEGTSEPVSGAETLYINYKSLKLTNK